MANLDPNIAKLLHVLFLGAVLAAFILIVMPAIETMEYGGQFWMAKAMIKVGLRLGRCPVCRRTFEKHSCNHKYCSRKCKSVDQLKRDNNRWQQQSQKLQLFAKLQAELFPHRPRKRRCKFCDKRIKRYSNRRKFCCHDCCRSYHKVPKYKRNS